MKNVPREMCIDTINFRATSDTVVKCWLIYCFHFTHPFNSFRPNFHVLAIKRQNVRYKN